MEQSKIHQVYQMGIISAEERDSLLLQWGFEPGKPAKYSKFKGVLRDKATGFKKGHNNVNCTARV